jgi:hypothetical protein
MSKGVRSNLAMSRSKLIYLFLFLIVAYVLYYMFREHFTPAYGGYKHDRRNDWLDLQKKELQDKIKHNTNENK